MPLSSGNKLGPYEILAPLGAGGMGEVYRARDTRLERTVAIKVLPSHLSADSIHKQRFEREAKTISHLNHPHICVLYDVGHQDGVDYLVMEGVEGETLAKRLEKGPLPLDQVLKYGAQLADALETAHRAEIVHRDLKPGNIMLTASGVKLLDFGLAKPALSKTAAETLMTAPAALAPLTGEGVIVGTFQYLSPEQLEGREADARSDIFAFGAVLYEMATGRKAFQGKTQASVIAAILEPEPPPISSFQPMVPVALDRVVKACLVKDGEQRWQTAHDVKLELQWIAEDGSQVGVPASLVSRRKMRERHTQAVAALGILLAVIAAIGWWRAARPSPVHLPMRLSAELPPGAIIDRFAGAGITLSPDGTRIVLVEAHAGGNFQLAVRRMDQNEFAPLS